MLNFLFYSVVLGFTLLFPTAFCLEYFKEPRGKREVTYGGAFLMFILSVIPVVNIVMLYFVGTSACELLGKTLAGRALLSDKGKK